MHAANTADATDATITADADAKLKFEVTVVRFPCSMQMQQQLNVRFPCSNLLAPAVT